MAIVSVAIDLAKNVFAVHGVDESGKTALVQTLVNETYAHLSSKVPVRRFQQQAFAAGCRRPQQPLHLRQQLSQMARRPVSSHLQAPENEPVFIARTTAIAANLSPTILQSRTLPTFSPSAANGTKNCSLRSGVVTSHSSYAASGSTTTMRFSSVGL